MSWIPALYLTLSILLIDCLIGGTRLLFSIPAYSLIGLAAVLTLASFRQSETSSPNRNRLRTLAVAVTVLVFGYLFARAWFSPVEYLARADLYSILACVVAYLLTAYFVTENRTRALVFGSLFVLAVAEVFIGLRQFTHGDNWMPFGFIRADYQRRASGTFISSIHLAGLLEVLGVFALSYALWSRWKLAGRVLSGYVGVLCYLGVAITGSRGGYLSSICSLIAFTLLSLFTVWRVRPDRFKVTALITLIAFTGLIGGGITLMNLSSMLRKRLATISQQFEAKSRDIRVLNWQAAWDQAQLNPSVGTGAGTHLFYGRYFRRPQLQVDPVHAHCDYLELLAEYGIIGACGIGLFLLIHAGIGLRFLVRGFTAEQLARTRDGSARSDKLALVIGALSALVAYLAHSAIDFNLHIPGNALLFAFIFGLLANLEGTPLGSARFSPMGRWMTPLLGVCLLGLILPKLKGEYWCEKARLALRRGEMKASIGFVGSALQSERANPDLYFYLGEANRAIANSLRVRGIRMEYYQGAVEAYRQGLGLFPQNENLWIRLGQSLDGLGEFIEAGTAYRTAIALDPGLGVLHTYYSTHLQNLGRSEEAEREKATGIRLSSGLGEEPVEGVKTQGPSVQ